MTTCKGRGRGCTKDLLCIDGVSGILVVVLLTPLSGRVTGRGLVDDGVLVDECGHGEEDTKVLRRRRRGYPLRGEGERKKETDEWAIASHTD